MQSEEGGVRTIPGSRFKFCAQSNQAYLRPGSVNGYPTCLGRIKHWDLTIGWHPQVRLANAKYVFKLPHRYAAKIECVAHPQRDWIMTSFILFNSNVEKSRSFFLSIYMRILNRYMTRPSALKNTKRSRKCSWRRRLAYAFQIKVGGSDLLRGRWIDTKLVCEGETTDLAMDWPPKAIA